MQTICNKFWQLSDLNQSCMQNSSNIVKYLLSNFNSNDKLLYSVIICQDICAFLMYVEHFNVI